MSRSSLRARALALAAAALAGCASMHGIAPQETAADPAALQTGRQLDGEAIGAAWPSGRWWQAFGDAQLDRLIDQAGAGNPDLTAARARVRLAMAAAGTARAATLPKVDAKLSAQDTLFTGQSFIPSPYAREFWWSNDAAIDFGYALDLWGGDEAALEAARADVRAGAAAEQAARLVLQSDIVQAYAQLALQYARRDVLAQDLQNRQQLVDITRQRLRAGIGTELELAQAQTGVPVAQSEIDAVDQQIEILHHQIAALGGQGPGAADDLQRPQLREPDGSLLPSHLPAELIGRRPDVAMRRWQVEAAAKNIDVAKARFYPNIDLVAGVGLESLGFYHFLNSDAAVANAGPAISLPIFDGSRLRAGLGARAAQYDEAVARYNGALVQALQQIADQVTTVRGLERQQAQIDIAVQSAQRAYDLAMQGYRAGIIDYLSVLTTESNLLAQRDRATGLRLHRLAAHAQLVAALGGGLSADTGPRPGGAETAHE
ncbi:MAG: efflux transporter outer membrane subunit [Solimonas sp.]